MITIDGSQGEGGGQILRSSLALSMATGRPFRMFNIRAGRPKPGLMRQHLTCVQAAAAICSGHAEGADVGSLEVTFIPGPVQPGTYTFPIGTAGGTTLVLQAILPALLRASGPSQVTVEGGTHNTAAPIFEYFDRVLVPLLNRAGACVKARLDRHGFYPVGGGRVVVDVEPAREPVRLDLTERGPRIAAKAVGIVSRLPTTIAQREINVLAERLDLRNSETEVLDVPRPVGTGNAMYVELQYEHVTEVFSAIGQHGRRAEDLAKGLSEDVRAYIATRRPVGPHLADQLMVPCALLAGASFTTGPLTPHARTNMDVLRVFGGDVSADEATGLVRVEPLRSGLTVSVPEAPRSR